LPLRSVGYNFLAVSQWMSPADNEQCIAWARETYATMQPFVGLGCYVNYLDHDELGEPVAAAYGPNYRRLQAIKAKYDPSNFFHMHQNIKPMV
jgi:FAD/FMN-containing dehydrogenase